jgi:hypothetical protein
MRTGYGGTIKPQWLVDFQSYLRAHPVRRAALWAVTCWALFQILHFWKGEQLTATRLIVETLAWSVAGLSFYVTMRWWDMKHAR